MSNDLKKEISNLKTEASELIGKAGFAVRNTKGFPEAVQLIERTLEVFEKMNNKLDATQEMIFERLEQ